VKKLSLPLKSMVLSLLISCSSDDDGNVENMIPILNVGDIIITEIMNNPSAVVDSEGEWFEIYNTTNDKTFNLENIAFGNGLSEFVIDKPLNIKPLSYIIFSQNDDPNTNGGVTVDYKYDNMNLGNIAGEIYIIGSSDYIDLVEYDSFIMEEGKSISLNPSNLNPSNHNDSSLWCLSLNQMSSGDFGTPGEVNECQ